MRNVYFRILFKLSIIAIACIMFDLAYNFGVAPAFDWPHTTMFQSACIVICSLILQKK